MALSKELIIKLTELRERHEEINLRLTELKVINQQLKRRQEELFFKFMHYKIAN